MNPPSSSSTAFEAENLQQKAAKQESFNVVEDFAGASIWLRHGVKGAPLSSDVPTAHGRCFTT